MGEDMGKTGSRIKAEGVEGRDPAGSSAKEIEHFIFSSGSDHIPTFGGAFEGGIQCQQVPDELAACVFAIIESKEKIESYLEIGVAAGGTTRIIHHFLKPETIVLIDDNKHPKAHLRPYILDKIQREEIIGDSRDPRTKDGLGTKVFDLMFVDADHSYEGVKADLENYLPYLRTGGFVALHDSIMPMFGIARKVQELKTDKRVQFVGEYASRNYAPRCGLALFQKVKDGLSLNGIDEGSD